MGTSILRKLLHTNEKQLAAKLCGELSRFLVGATGFEPIYRRLKLPEGGSRKVLKSTSLKVASWFSVSARRF